MARDDSDLRPSDTNVKPLLVIALATAAWVLGVVAGEAVFLGLNALLPSVDPKDGDTLRQFLLVALAYLTLGTTTLVVFILGWRRLRHWRA